MVEMNIAVSGALGRMGRRVGLALKGMEGVNYYMGLVKTEQLDAKDIMAPLSDNVDNALKTCDVLLDFTSKRRAVELAELCAKVGKPILIGTTGFDSNDFKRFECLSKNVAILYAPNLTMGAATLFLHAEELARHLGRNYDVKVIGIHHNKKKEIPSGTSVELARRIQAGRQDKESPEIASLLAGGAYGVHEILFASDSEEIRVSHNVTKPTIDYGVLQLSLDWLVENKKGFATLSEILF